MCLWNRWVTLATLRRWKRNCFVWTEQLNTIVIGSLTTEAYNNYDDAAFHTKETDWEIEFVCLKCSETNWKKIPSENKRMSLVLGWSVNLHNFRLLFNIKIPIYSSFFFFLLCFPVDCQRGDTTVSKCIKKFRKINFDVVFKNCFLKRHISLRNIHCRGKMIAMTGHVFLAADNYTFLPRVSAYNIFVIFFTQRNP